MAWSGSVGRAGRLLVWMDAEGCELVWSASRRRIRPNCP